MHSQSRSQNPKKCNVTKSNITKYLYSDSFEESRRFKKRTAESAVAKLYTYCTYTRAFQRVGLTDLRPRLRNKESHYQLLSNSALQCLNMKGEIKYRST